MSRRGNGWSGPVVAGLVLVVALLQRLLTTAVASAVVGRDRLFAALTSHDTKWYEGVVTGGYRLGDASANTNLAFFPLFPLAARVVAWLPGVTPAGALLALGVTGSVVAALPIFAIGKHLHSAEVGWWLVLLWGAAPQSIVLVMGYPEGWFTAATAFALLFLLQSRPIPAAVSAIVAGLLRPAALPLVVVVMLWCLLQARSGDVRRHLLAAALAPLGIVSFVSYVGWRTGNPFGYLDVQRAWNLRLGAPWEFVNQIDELLTTANQLVVSTDFFVPVVLGHVALLVWLLGRWREPDYPWLIVYCVLATLLILARGPYFWSEPRQFLPLFPLLLPLATIRTSRWAWVALAVGATAATAWLGAAVLAAGQYSI